MRVLRASAAACLAASLCALTGCAIAPGATQAQWVGSAELSSAVMTQTVSVASLSVSLPASWKDVSSSQADETFPVAYAASAETNAATIRFSPNFHDAGSVGEALDLAEQATAATPSPQPNSTGTMQTEPHFPGAGAVRTLQRSYTTEAGTPMLACWWLLEDAATGTIYAAQFQGQDTPESAEVIELIDTSLSLGAA